MMSRFMALLAAVFAAVALTSTAASAFRGGSQDGDGWLNDAQKNPRFIEPYADRNPARYRAYQLREGWYDRQRAWGYSRRGQGYYD